LDKLEITMSIVLKHSIELKEKEVYLELANSRIGGNPDLPFEMKYSVYEMDFMNLFCKSI